jgi:hypothetical protein
VRRYAISFGSAGGQSKLAPCLADDGTPSIHPRIRNRQKAHSSSVVLVATALPASTRSSAPIAPVIIFGSVKQSKTALLRGCGLLRRKCYVADPKISKLIQKNHKQSHGNAPILLRTDRVEAGRLREH